MRLLISGGHLTPALALIDYIQSLNNKKYEIIFVGRTYSQKKQLSHEQQEIKKRKIKFIDFNAPKFNSNNLLIKFKNFFVFIFFIFKALIILIKIRPKIFISFGGYLALPMAIASFILRIPIITHEQTLTAGQANRIIAKLAQKIAVSHPKTLKLFPKNKTVLTGNPIRLTLTKKVKAPQWAKDLPSPKPLLFITGGNQGSLFINNLITQILPKITSNWNVIHACGNPTAKMDYKKELQKAKRKLNSNGRKSYLIRVWLSDQDLAWVYQHASTVISRSGANTVAELAFFKIPSILIPLPFAKNNEQVLNAKYLSETGGCEMIYQKDLSPDLLIKKLNYFAKYHNSLKIKLRKITSDINAVCKLWREIDLILNPKK